MDTPRGVVLELIWSLDTLDTKKYLKALLSKYLNHYIFSRTVSHVFMKTGS